MVQKQRSDYLSLRRAFEPMAATLVIVAEFAADLGQVLLRSGRQGENWFNVLNKGRIVYFPAAGNQRDFDRQFREIVPQTLRGEGL